MRKRSDTGFIQPIIKGIIVGIIFQLLIFQILLANPANGIIETSSGIYGFDKKSPSVFFRTQVHLPVSNTFVKPVVGLFLTGQGGIYSYGGISFHINLFSQIQLISAFTPGLYWRGDDINLGGRLEFESSIQVAYRLNDNITVSTGISHLSNAGIYSSNPGVETLSFNYYFHF